MQSEFLLTRFLKLAEGGNKCPYRKIIFIYYATSVKSMLPQQLKVAENY